jgi:type IV secretion system protein VirD4
VPVEQLEVWQAWDPRELPAKLAELSEDDVSAYVERHFMLLGVPRDRIVAARRTLSLSELDVAELRAAAATRKRRAGGNASGAKEEAGPASRADLKAKRRRESQCESNVGPITGGR